MNTRSSRAKYSVRMVAVAIAIGVLGACAPSVPSVHPGAEPARPLPVVDAEQSARILAAIDETVVTADSARSAPLLAGRVTEPASAIRAAQYQIATARNDDSKVSPVTFDAEVAMVAATDAWPRFYFVSGKMVGDTDNQIYPFVVLTQNSPRDQYQLWGWARRLPQQALPTVALPSEGSDPLAPDASGLVMTPQEAVNAYADVRNSGANSQWVNSFASDEMTTQILDGAAAAREALSASASYDVVTAPTDGQLFALRTSDGGAIIATQYQRTATVTVNPGQSVELAPDVAALAGITTVYGQEVSVYADIAVLYVPPAGSTEQISVLCAEAFLVSAQGQ